MANTNRLFMAIIASLFLIGIPAAASAGKPVFKRTQLQRNDVNVPSPEMVVTHVELAPEAIAPKHTHPGIESMYLLEGKMEVTLEGKPAQVLKAGDTIFVPVGTAHSAKNLGKTPAKLVATYIVEKGKPLATAVK